MLCAFVSYLVVTQIDVLDVNSELVESGTEGDQSSIVHSVVEVLFVVSLDHDLKGFVVLHSLLKVLHEGVMRSDLDLLTFLLVQETYFLFVKFSVFCSHIQLFNKINLY